MRDLNEEQSLMVAREDLGTIQTLVHRGQTVRYRLPEKIEDQVTLRFRGHGRTEGAETGDLLLHITVDRGRDVHGVLWLCQSEARAGCVKRVVCGKYSYRVKVPVQCRDGQTLRLKGQGRLTEFGGMQRQPTRGDVLIRLVVFPDEVKARVQAVEGLSTDDLWLEGWIYRRADQVLRVLRASPLRAEAFTAGRVADLYNEEGWLGIGAALMRHLLLDDSQVRLESSATLEKPGRCTTKVTTQNNPPVTFREHTICIHTHFLDNPFAVAAILAHEFCHVLELRYFGAGRTENLTGNELMEMERTVDLLVFLHGLGEFQMRVARQENRTLGYFNQELFERMHVFWSRKQKEFWRNGPATPERTVNPPPDPGWFDRIKKSFGPFNRGD